MWKTPLFVKKIYSNVWSLPSDCEMYQIKNLTYMKQLMMKEIVNCKSIYFLALIIYKRDRLYLSTSLYTFCKRLINTLREYIIDFLHSVNQHPIVSQLVQTRQNKSKEAMQQKSIVDSKSKI